MADVYIAHAREDRARAEALAEALKARDMGVALQAASDTKAVLALWSARGLETADLVRDAQRARGRGALISARIEPAVEAPEGAGPILVDLSAWPGEAGAEQFERLVQAIAALRGRPAPAATTRAGNALMQRVLIGAGIAALLVVSAIALVNVRSAETRVASLPGPTPDYEEDAGEFTDSPGASEMYGLEESDLGTLEPRDLIIRALETSSIETIEVEAAGGDVLGRSLLCLAHFYGEGFAEADLDAARRVCASASEGGDALATYVLSLLVREGQPGYAASPADASESDRLLALAAEQGDPRAQVEMARIAITREDYQAALDLAEAAARQHYPPAYVVIGAMYEHGLGMETNPSQAMQWYVRAEQAGSPAGMRSVGGLYEAGAGVARDFGQARRRYEAASEKGDGEASYRLASLLERGLGGDRDLERARSLYRLAIDQGFSDAQADLARIGPG